MTSLDHVLECSVVICATRSTVFRFFKDSRRFAEWWGEGSQIEGRPGGVLAIRYPDGTTASGTIQEIVEGERIVFSYGYDAPGKLIPPGGSRIIVTLHEHPEGTLLKLRHELADAASRDAHVQGWKYQLALFANAAARDQHGDLASPVDRYFALWAEPDAALRRAELEAVATEGVVFRDAFGSTRGRDDLNAHIGATRVHMPGASLRREGSVRHCQGTRSISPPTGESRAWWASGPAERRHGTSGLGLTRGREALRRDGSSPCLTIGMRSRLRRRGKLLKIGAASRQ